MSDFWSDTSSVSILHVCEQRRLWRDYADAQARLSFAGRLCDKYHNLITAFTPIDDPVVPYGATENKPICPKEATSA